MTATDVFEQAVGRRLDEVEGMFEVGVCAVVGVGDVEPAERRRVFEQQAELGGRTVGPEREQPLVMAAVE